MKYIFTLDKTPSQESINLIKQIAYTYRAICINGKPKTVCLN